MEVGVVKGGNAGRHWNGTNLTGHLHPADHVQYNCISREGRSSAADADAAAAAAAITAAIAAAAAESGGTTVLLLAGTPA